MISRSEKRRTRKGSTSGRLSGPPRFRSTTPTSGRVATALHRAGEHGPFPRLRAEVAVERHAHVPHEEPAPRRHLQAVGADLQEVVRHWPPGRPELAELLLEVAREVDAERALHDPDVEAEVEHDIGDTGRPAQTLRERRDE